MDRLTTAGQVAGAHGSKVSVGTAVNSSLPFEVELAARVLDTGAGDIFLVGATALISNTSLESFGVTLKLECDLALKLSISLGSLSDETGRLKYKIRRWSVAYMIM